MALQTKRASPLTNNFTLRCASLDLVYFALAISYLVQRSRLTLASAIGLKEFCTILYHQSIILNHSFKEDMALIRKCANPHTKTFYFRFAPYR